MPETRAQAPETLAQAIADAAARADALKADLHHGLFTALAERLPDLRAAIAEQQSATEALLELIAQQGPEAYPDGARSQTAFGVRWGWQKTKPKLVVPDHGRSIAAARTRYRASDVETIVDTKETIRVSALGSWPDDELAHIHVHREPACDQPFVRGVDTDIDRLTKAIVAQALATMEGNA